MFEKEFEELPHSQGIGNYVLWGNMVLERSELVITS